MSATTEATSDAMESDARPTDTTASVTDREASALAIVKANAGWSSAAGLLPLPLLDLAAISAVQLRMIKQLTDLYGLPFSAGAAKAIAGALIGGGGAFLVAAPVASLIKVIPVVGTFLSTFASPTIAAASTYALGKVFIQHFESGGTMLTLDPKAVRDYFNEEFRKAKGEVSKA